MIPAPSHPWDRQAGETEEAYAAFLIYRDLGPQRSLTEVARRWNGGGTNNRSRLGAWSSRFGWVERCRVWENHLRRVRDEGTEDAVRAWEQRRLRRAEADWALAEKFLARASELAEFPVACRSREGGRTVVQPIGSRTLRDAAAIAREAQAMAWAAIREGLATDDDDFDPETASIEELRAYLEMQGRRRKAPPGGAGG